MTKLQEFLVFGIVLVVFLSGLTIWRYSSAPYSPCTDEDYLYLKQIAFKGRVVEKKFNHSWLIYAEFDNGTHQIGGFDDLATAAELGDSVLKESGTIYCTLQKKDKTTAVFPLAYWLEETEKECDSTSGK